MTAWDPIGVGDAPEAWDQYDSYQPGVAYRLRDAPDPELAGAQVADYLNHVERDFMEDLTEDRRRANSYFADSLLGWYEWSFAAAAAPRTSG